MNYKFILPFGLAVVFSLPDERRAECEEDKTGAKFNLTSKARVAPEVIESVLTHGKTTSELLGDYIHVEPAYDDYEDDVECREPRQDLSRSVLSNTKYRWYPKTSPGVGYPWMALIFNESYTTDERLVFAAALHEIESQTCVRFYAFPVVTNIPGDDYVEVTNNMEGCYSSHIGRQGIGRQVINLSPTSSRGKCKRKGVIIHQLLHALGFVHQHRVPERDGFVRIHLDNVDPAETYQFDKVAAGSVEPFGVTYDYDSIMHYNKKGFSQNGKATIVPFINVEIGQRLGLSEGDVKKINRMHNCVPP